MIKFSFLYFIVKYLIHKYIIKVYLFNKYIKNIVININMRVTKNTQIQHLPPSIDAKTIAIQLHSTPPLSFVPALAKNGNCQPSMHSYHNVGPVGKGQNASTACMSACQPLFSVDLSTFWDWRVDHCWPKWSTYQPLLAKYWLILIIMIGISTFSVNISTLPVNMSNILLRKIAKMLIIPFLKRQWSYHSLTYW